MRGAPFVVGVLLLLSGCASSGQTDIATLASNSDQLIFDTGMRALEKRQWEPARQHFRRIIDGFPRSEHGAAARLALADSYFREGGAANYILAAPAYRDFLTLFPSHPKSDYAQFQIAETYFMQRNGPDRDQRPTQYALDEYNRLLQTYPSSAYGDTARARIAQCRYNLARAEYLAGFFYQRTRQSCRSAIPRYQGLITTYPEYRELDVVLYRLSLCLAESGRGAEALPLLARLLKDFPTSEWADEAQVMMGQAPTGAPPVAAPATAPQALPSPAP